jgi:hypothetical protein
MCVAVSATHKPNSFSDTNAMRAFLKKDLESMMVGWKHHFSVRVALAMLVGLLGLVTVSVGPSSAIEKPEKEDRGVRVVPIFECAAPEGGGLFSAFFSFENLSKNVDGSPMAITIPRGPKNKVTPAAYVGYAPEKFGFPNVVPGRPGRTAFDVAEPKAFIVRGWNGKTPIKWKLGDEDAEASSETRCKGRAFPPTAELLSPSRAAPSVGQTTVAVKVPPAPFTATASVVTAIDGRPLGTLASAPWSLPFNTSILADGDHVLTLVATDTAGVVYDDATYHFSTLNFPNFDQLLSARRASGQITIDQWATQGVSQIVFATTADAALGVGASRFAKDVENTARLIDYLDEWPKLSATTKSAIEQMLTGAGPRSSQLASTSPSVAGRGRSRMPTSATGVSSNSCMELPDPGYYTPDGELPLAHHCSYAYPASRLAASPFGYPLDIPAITISYVQPENNSLGLFDPRFEWGIANNDKAGDFGADGPNGVPDIVDEAATTARYAAAAYAANGYGVGVDRLFIDFTTSVQTFTGRPLTSPVDFRINYPAVDYSTLTLRHEVFHVYQFAAMQKPSIGAGWEYAGQSVGWWMEATAAWAEGLVIRALCEPRYYGDSRVVPGYNPARTCSHAQDAAPDPLDTIGPSKYVGSLQNFLGKPTGRLDEGGASKGRSYGAVPLVEYLTERFRFFPPYPTGPTFVRETFDRIKTGRTALEAIDDVLASRRALGVGGARADGLKTIMVDFWETTYEQVWPPNSAYRDYVRRLQEVWGGESPAALAVKGDTEAFGLLGVAGVVSDAPRVGRWQKPYKALVGEMVAIKELTVNRFGVGFLDVRTFPFPQSVVTVKVENIVGDVRFRVIRWKAPDLSSTSSGGYPNRCTGTTTEGTAPVPQTDIPSFPGPNRTLTFAVNPQADCRDFTLEVVATEDNPYPMKITISAA